MLEQAPLALHDGLSSQGSDVAQSQDGSAVGDDAHQVGLARVHVGSGRIGGYLATGCGHTGRIGQREVLLGMKGLDGQDFKFAGTGGAMVGQRFCVEIVSHVVPLLGLEKNGKSKAVP